MKKKVSDIVAEFLAKKGFSHAFGVTGGGAMHLNDSFSNNKKIKFIHTHHEQTAAMAADSYFRQKRAPAIVHTTSGPGGTNAITGVVGAWIDSIPMFVVSGQVPRDQLISNTKTRQIGVQEVNISNLVKSVTKYSVTIKNPLLIMKELEKCYFYMQQGTPGPVWIDIPLDVQAKVVNTKKLETYKFKKNYKSKNDKNIKRKIFHLLKLIKHSKKPLIVVGNGIHVAEAEDGFLKFHKKIKIPIISSWNASDLINTNDKFYIGRMGLFGDRASNFAAQSCDLLIVFASKLSIPQTGYDTKSFAKNAKKIIIDIDKHELNKNAFSNIKLKINYDIKDFFYEINKVIKNKKISFKFSKWRDVTLGWKNKYPVFNKIKRSSGNFINSFHLMEELSKACKGDETIVTDMGTSFTCTMQALKIKNHKKQRLFTSSGLAAMGFGLPGAIGASFANKNKQIICITGDGGLMFNIQELQTIKHYNLPIKIFVLENKGYLTMQLMQKKNFKKLVGSDDSTGVSIPKIKKIANGFDIKYKKLKNNKLSQQIKKVFSNKGPAIVEVNMQKFQPLIPRLQSKLLKDGTFVPMVFDDLYPHLPEKVMLMERFKANI